MPLNHDDKWRMCSSQNRMKESMLLFSSICNMKYFTTTPFILFLNKTDIFQRKIAFISITVAFPEYSGNVFDWSIGFFILNIFVLPEGSYFIRSYFFENWNKANNRVAARNSNYQNNWRLESRHNDPIEIYHSNHLKSCQPITSCKSCHLARLYPIT